MPKHVFISYVREQRPFVQRLVGDLAEAGFATWWDARIQPGARWADEIGSAVHSAGVLIWVASAQAGASDWMRRELEMAAGVLSLPVIPLILDDAGAESLPENLRDYQWVDFRGDYGVGLKTLVRALPTHLVSDVPEEPPAERTKGYVFISYASKDEEYVGLLRDFLAQRSYAYWSFTDSERNYQTSIARELEGRINDARALISILSPAWKESEWTERELLYAQAVGKPYFLVKVREMPPSILAVGRLLVDISVDVDVGLGRLADELSKQGL